LYISGGMPSSGWLSSIRRQIVGPVDTKSTILSNGGDTINFTNQNRKNNMNCNAPKITDSYESTEKAKSGTITWRKTENNVGAFTSKKITYVEESESSNYQEPPESPPLQALPYDPHIPAVETLTTYTSNSNYRVKQIALY